MTEKQKKLALIVGTIVIGLIILLWSRKSVGDTIINKQNAPGITVSIPSLDFPERSPIAINIPGLPSFTPYQFSAISPCMCNGAASTYQPNTQPLFEIVNNAADSGPNIYNNYYSSSNDYAFVAQPQRTIGVWV